MSPLWVALAQIELARPWVLWLLPLPLLALLLQVVPALAASSGGVLIAVSWRP